MLKKFLNKKKSPPAGNKPSFFRRLKIIIPMPKIAIIILLLGVLAFAGVFFYSQISQPEQTPPQESEGPSFPDITKGRGMIEGSLSYPSEEIPAEMAVCAESVDSGKKYCSGEQLEDSKYIYGKGYQLEAPAGDYYVFAKAPNIDEYAYYSKFVTCGLGAECDSHRPIKVTVRADKLTGRIDPIDWYARPDLEVDFIQSGNLVLSQDKNKWALLYEEPGQPALKVDLIFDDQSLCDLGQEAKNCLIIPHNYWQVGDWVAVEGEQSGNQVLVGSLKIAQTKDDLIKIHQPLPNQVIESPLKIKGQARGNWFFEADFPVVLADWDGLIIGQAIARAKGEWMTENFVVFEAELNFERPDYKDNGNLILKKDNPSGLPENDNVLEIQVFFKD